MIESEKRAEVPDLLVNEIAGPGPGLHIYIYILLHIYTQQRES